MTVNNSLIIDTGGKTNRLAIRIIEHRDLEFARLLHNADNTLLYLSDIEQVSEPQQEKWYEGLCLSSTSRRYIMTELDTGDYVGVFRVDQLDWKNRSVCVGLDIESSKRGNRYASEIYQYFLEYFFSHCGLQRVYLAVLDTNDRAQGLYESLGFVEEGKSRAALFRGGRFQDLIWMSILSDEFNSSIS
jgi:RimJ/RimL family protein N-acetyltransferase